jgi:hypothetical protein
MFIIGINNNNNNNNIILNNKCVRLKDFILLFKIGDVQENDERMKVNKHSLS